MRPPILVARLALMLTVSAVSLSSVSAKAAAYTPSSLGRSQVAATQYTWWLVSRAVNKVVCVIVVGHDGEPTFDEIADSCGADLAREWHDSPACPYDPARTTPCGGLYVRPAGASQVVQPGALAVKPGHPLWLDLPGCNRARVNWVCESPPVLRITADDAETSDPPVAILALVGSETTKCPGSPCDVPLEPTPPEGLELAFWSTLTSGGISERFTGRVRLIEETGGDQPHWDVDLLSAQFEDDRMDRCALAWDSLPALEGRPAWLGIPDSAADLWTSEPYAQLDARLATLGLQAEAAPGEGGLFAPAQTIAWTSATTLLEAWQNLFDPTILDSAASRGLPPRLLKGLFAAESQFWPGSFPDLDEVGLGQLSLVGADTLLLWSPPFFSNFCPQVLHPDSCNQGYSRMPESQKAMLRAALMARVNAECSDCTYGLDLAKADGSVGIFAESLVASCSQTGRMIFNLTGEAAGHTSSYEDLWRLTLADYNAGSGCLANALASATKRSERLTWPLVASSLSSGCSSAIDHVSRVLHEPLVESRLQTTPSPSAGLGNQ